MKKIILTVAAVFALSFANAQDKKESSAGFSKGDVFVSGAITYGSTDDKDADLKTSNFTIAPKLGYFVTENIAIGGQISYSSTKDGDIDNVMGIDVSDLGNTFSVNTLGFGVFGRYYFTPASQFSLFGQLGVDYMSATIDEVDGESTTGDNKVNGFGAGLGLGMNYSVSSRFSLEAGVGVLNFMSAKPNADGFDGVSSFTFGGNWNAITFGLNYKF
jgi:outer membrane protein